MSSASFTSAPVAARIAAVAGAVSPIALPAHSGLRLADAQVAGRAVLVAATDPALDRGVLGVAECADLRHAVRLARQTRRPLVLLIDSAGARLDAGLAIQGALRGLMADLLDAGLAGLPMLALLGRHVFGGASMLAFAAGRRCYAAETVLAMSGPRVLEQAGGQALPLVRAAIGGVARCRHGGAEHLLEDTLPAYATALRDWVAGLPAGPLPDALDEERRMLEARLDAQTPQRSARFGIDPDSGALRCSGRADIGAADALEFARQVEQAGASEDLLIDCAGHSLQLGDEALILSQYLVHLARTLRRRVQRGPALRLRIAGEISGGIYIATAGAASSVDIAAGGSVRTLPQAALSRILTRPDAAMSNAGADLASYAGFGVADTLSALAAGAPIPRFAMP